MRKALLRLLVLGLAPGGLLAQNQEPELDTDRPSFSQSPAVVPRGTLQLETGLPYQYFKSGPLQVRGFSYPDALLRVGLLEWAEWRLHASYTKERQHREGPAAAPDERGFDRVQVGTKVHLRAGKGAMPAIGVLGLLTLPVGSRAFRPAHVAPEVALLFESRLSERVALEYNIGYGKRPGGEEYQDEAFYSLVLAIERTQQLAYFVEFFGLKPRGAPAHTADAGIQVKVRPNLQLDLSGGAGLSRAAPVFFVDSGLSWRLPR